MSGQEPDKPEFEDASSALADGLKSCHAVVASYRAALTGEKENAADETGAADAPSIPSESDRTPEA